MNATPVFFFSLSALHSVWLTTEESHEQVVLPAVHHGNRNHHSGASGVSVLFILKKSFPSGESAADTCGGGDTD